MHQIMNIIGSSQFHKGSQKLKYLMQELQKEINLLINEKNTLSGKSTGDLRAISNSITILQKYKLTKELWLPRPILITQPKSGTKHIEAFFVQLYNFSRLTPVHSFSDINQLPDSITKVTFAESNFMIGHNLISYHLRPGKDLIKIINKYQFDVILCLRNPIQALVSHYYYILKNDLKSLCTNCPGDYFNSFKIKNEGELRLFLIQKLYPKIISFIEQWMTCIESKDLQSSIVLVSHEMLVNEPNLFHQKLSSSIGRDEDDHWKKYKQISNHNFRRGKTDEWETFFTSAEKSFLLEKLNQLLEAHPTLNTLFYMKSISQL